MSTRVPWRPSGFDELPTDEKVEYVQSLWDRIAASDETVPVPEWHKAIIHQRVNELETAPDSVVDWAEVRDQITRDLHRFRHNP